jgi:hypothetical protein
MTITATSDNQIRKSNICNWTIGLQTFATGFPTAERFSATGRYGTSAVTADQSALMPANLITLAHFSVSSGDEPAKVGRRADKRCGSEVSQLRLDFQIGERGIDLPVELVDDFGRRAFG